MLKSTLLYIKQGLNTHIGAFSPVIIIEDHIYRVLFTHSTKVYLITNIPLEEQYTNIQDKQPATWNALLRRIHHYLFYSSTGIHELDINKLKI